MNSWRKMTLMEHDLNIGVIGSPGVGKSTFINTVRRLKPTDSGAAPTGVVQTTMEPQLYRHPQNTHVIFWDFPGCGTPTFSREKYLEEIDSMKYDLFIIICCSRFTEYDLCLVNAMRNTRKRFYFVRTKTDIDVRNYRHDYPQIPIKDVLKKLRTDCSVNLSAGTLQESSVFLICKNPIAYEFATFEEAIINDLPEDTRQSLLLTLSSVSAPIISDKARILMEHSWSVTENSAVVTEVAHPELRIKVDTHYLCSEILAYKKVFGLDNEGLKQLSKLASVPEPMLVDAVKDNFWSNVSADTLLKAMNTWNARGGADNDAQHANYAGKEDAHSVPKITEDCKVASELSITEMKDFLRYLIVTMHGAIIDVISKAKEHFQQSNLM